MCDELSEITNISELDNISNMTYNCLDTSEDPYEQTVEPEIIRNTTECGVTGFRCAVDEACPSEDDDNKKEKTHEKSAFYYIYTTQATDLKDIVGDNGDLCEYLEGGNTLEAFCNELDSAQVQDCNGPKIGCQCNDPQTLTMYNKDDNKKYGFEPPVQWGAQGSLKVLLSVMSFNACRGQGIVQIDFLVGNQFLRMNSQFIDMPISGSSSGSFGLFKCTGDDGNADYFNPTSGNCLIQTVNYEMTMEGCNLTLIMTQSNPLNSLRKEDLSGLTTLEALMAYGNSLNESGECPFNSSLGCQGLSYFDAVAGETVEASPKQLISTIRHIADIATTILDQFYIEKAKVQHKSDPNFNTTTYTEYLCSQGNQNACMFTEGNHGLLHSALECEAAIDQYIDDLLTAGENCLVTHKLEAELQMGFTTESGAGNIKEWYGQCSVVHSMGNQSMAVDYNYEGRDTITCLEAPSERVVISNHEDYTNMKGTSANNAYHCKEITS
jgi:hypothetical protein